MENPIVQISEGKLKGKLRRGLNDKEYYAFKGIPYAKPPIGERRFSIPEPPEPWNGIRDATIDCNICAQFDKETGSVIGDEDCLYLNVYTPKLPEASSDVLPVMVFLHGGGFVFGSGTDDSQHGPDFIIQKDVIFVSLNYRLGILGFLSLDKKEAPGNMGLRDQVQALKWVQQNISKFCGDPGNVTIFGISAGAASVEYLMLSPMAKGLFHKALAQSGSSLLHWACNKNVKALASKIPQMKNKGKLEDNDLLNFLKDLPAKELLELSMAAVASDEKHGGIHFGFVPTVENPVDWEPFLDRSTLQLLTKGEFSKVPFMAGFCTREGLLMLFLGPDILEDLIQEKDFFKYFPFKLDDRVKPVIASKLKSLYLEGREGNQEADDFAIDFFTDVDFLGGIYVATTQMAKNNSPVYFYEFSYDGGLNYLKNKLNIRRKGACHGDDGGYLIKSNISTPNELSETDLLVRDRMVELFTNFAKYGDPTPQVTDLIPTKWEPIKDTGAAVLQIDDKLTMKYGIYPQRLKMYQELYEKYYE